MLFHTSIVCSFYYWIVFHCMDVTVCLSPHLLTFQALLLQFFSSLYYILSVLPDATPVTRFGIVPRLSLTFWEHCYSSFSVIHSGNYFWTLVIYSPIASHAAISNFFSTIIIMLLCEHSPWVHVPGFLHGICLWIGFLGCRTCIFFSFTYTVQSGHTNLPVYKSLPASYSFQHLVLSGFLFFIHTMGMKWNHVF